MTLMSIHAAHEWQHDTLQQEESMNEIKETQAREINIH